MDLARIDRFLASEAAAGRASLPSLPQVLSAFAVPFDRVRVVVVGQDPYPTPGMATGLAFSVPAHLSPLPPSLRNVLAEYSADLGLPPPLSGDLSPWVSSGVLLLNRVLTVAPGAPGSHAGVGWEVLTSAVVSALSRRPVPPPMVLWGRRAQELMPSLVAAGVPVVASAHPSPLSARRGFFGSRPFSRVDRILAASSLPPVRWRLPS